MKILIILASLLAVTTSYPMIKAWTLNELSDVIERSEGASEVSDMRKYYIHALNVIMYALFTGKQEAAVNAYVLSPGGHKKWSLEELQTALDDPTLSDALRPSYERSYHYLTNNKFDEPVNEIEVIVPALDISVWTVDEVLEAMKNPNTKPGLMAYLEKTKTEIGKGKKKTVTLVTPVGLIQQSLGYPKDETSPKLIAKILALMEEDNMEKEDVPAAIAL